MGCAVRLSDHGSAGWRLIPSGARSPRFNTTFRFLHESSQKMAAAESLMRAFRACAVPDRRLSRAHDSTIFGVQNSLVAGKNAGNFAESASFCENPSRKHVLFQLFASKIPYTAEQGIFSGEQGISSAFSTGAGNLARMGRAAAFERRVSLARQISDPDKEFAQSAVGRKQKSQLCSWLRELSQFSPTSRRGADTAQPLAARTRNPIERPVARSGRREVEERETI